MKFICLDDGAVAEMVSGREFQSVDFDVGQKLIQTMREGTELIRRTGKVVLSLSKDGMFFATAGSWKSKRYLVIDCEASGLFGSINESDGLTSFQKLLRFCAKIWSNSGVFNASERMISNSTKSILFPLPFSGGSRFRIAIERDPAPDRLQKREMRGHFLLVYKSGSDSADSSVEVASTTNFTKAFDALQEHYASLPKKIEQLDNVGKAGTEVAVGSIDLVGVPNGSGNGTILPFADWLPRLTRSQLSFVTASPAVAQRLVGAAGTGKTLTLLMRTIWALKNASRNQSPFRALFVTHSEATKTSVLAMLDVMDEDGFARRDPLLEEVSLSVETLASLCAKALNQAISPTELVDRDAQDSKLLQELYIQQAIESVQLTDLRSYAPHMTVDFRKFVEEQETADLAPIFQHEISVQIKGRAGESFDIYKKCPPLKYGLPVGNDADRGYAFEVFRSYRSQLVSTNQFDTDDVVLTAIGQLDTPIWRRRRTRDGFNFIAIDEAHLFNINELHVFHFFTRKIGEFPISFAIDRPQAAGDRGWESDSSLSDTLTPDGKSESTVYSTAFRSAPDILYIAGSILASGATLFTNFDNRLLETQSGFTVDEERRAQPVYFRLYSNDEEMISAAFDRATELATLTTSRPWEILITTLSRDLAEALKTFAAERNKPVTYLDKRGDFSRVSQAKKSGHFVVGHADYVGGLEFNVVIIVGVDKGRVPNEGVSEDADSRSFAKYIAHNRLYVAVSRAKFALEFSGIRARGPSDLLDNALSRGIIKIE